MNIFHNQNFGLQAKW